MIDRARESVRREPLLQGLRVLVGREMESAIAGPAGGRHGEGAIAGPVGSRHKERNRWGLQVVDTERERSLGPADGDGERAIAGACRRRERARDRWAWRSWIRRGRHWSGGRGSEREREREREQSLGLQVVARRESDRWACWWWIQERLQGL